MKKKVLYLLFIFFGYNASAVVTIPISTLTGFCGNSGIYQTIPNISFLEGSGYDFGNGNAGIFNTAIILSAPAGFEFKPTSGIQVYYGSTLSYTASTVTKTTVTLSLGGPNSTPQIEELVLSGLQIKSTSNSFENANITYSLLSGSPIAGLVNGTTVVNLRSSPSGFVNGWSDNICRTNGIFQVDLFPPNGTISMNNGCSNASSYTFTGSQLFIRPTCFSVGINGITFNYTFLGAINGCNQMYREADNIMPINYSFTVTDNDFSLPYTQTSVVSLTPSSTPTNIVFSFSGLGISGNSFNPNAVSGPYPRNVSVSMRSLNTLTGCSGIFSRTFTVFDPLKVLNFNPTPPLEIENNTLIGVFCINDYQVYAMTLNTANVSLPGIFFPLSLSGRGVSLTAPSPLSTTLLGGNYGMDYGISVVGAGFGNINNFRLLPSIITNTGISSYFLFYMADTLIGSGRSQPFSYLNTKQAIKIAAPINKLARDSTTVLQSFCLGNVTNGAQCKVKDEELGAILKWYRITGTGVNAKTLVATTSGVSIPVTLLGVTNASPVGVYTFAGTQKRIGGCESDTLVFLLQIKTLPTLPGISSSVSAFCSDTTYSVSFQPTLTTVGYTYNWHATIPTSSGVNIYSSNTISAPVTVNSSTIFYLTTSSNGCSSNEFISTIAGPNTTVRPISLNFLDRPQLPSISGLNNYCVGDIVNPVTIQGVFTSQVSFRWYSSTTTGAIIPSTISGTITTSAGILHLGEFNTNVNTAIQNSFQFFVKSRDNVSGCKSLLYLPVNIVVFQNPNPPSVFLDDLSGFIGSSVDTLNRSPYCFDGSSNTLIGIVLSTLTSPFFLKYDFNQSLTGVNTLNNLFSSSTRRNIVGEEILYFKQVVNGCSSDFRKIVVKVNEQLGIPELTFAGPVFNCTNFPMTDLVSTTTVPSGFIQWYSSVTGVVQNLSISGNGLTKNLNPVSLGLISNTIAGNYFFLSNVIDKYQCSSFNSIVNVSYRTTPSPPNIYDTAYCAGTINHGLIRADALVLANQSFEWSYNSSILNSYQSSTTTGGTRYQESISSSFLGSNFPNVNNDYFVDVIQIVNGCSSNNSTLKVFIKSNPPPPSNIALPRGKDRMCVGTSIFTLLRAQNGQPNLKWYNSSTLSSVVSTTTSYNTAETITITSAPVWTSNTSVASPIIFYFYNTQTFHSGVFGNATFSGCTSVPRKDSVFYFPIPPTPNLVSFTGFCVRDVLTAITASGPNLTAPTFIWYLGTAIGSSLQNGAIYAPNVTNLTANVNFYSVSQTHFAQNGFAGCESPVSTTEYLIKPLPIVSISTSKPILNKQVSFCNSDPLITFSGSSLGGNFSSTFLGFTNNGSSAFFNPSLTFSGFTFTSPITYTYTEPSTSCTDSKAINVEINKIPGNMSIEIKDPATTTLTGYCARQNDSYQLNLNNDQNGAGVSLVEVFNNSNIPVVTISGIFNPYDLLANNLIRNSLDAPQVRIQYTYTLNISGCSNIASLTKNLFAQPIFSTNIPFQEDSQCEQIPITLNTEVVGFVEPSSTVLGSGLAYLWSGNEISGSNPTVSVSGYNGIFTPGTKSIQVNIKTQYGCQLTGYKLVRVGPFPKALFNISNICEGDLTNIIDKSTISNGIILQRIIDFGDGTINDTITLNGLGNNTITGHIYSILGQNMVVMTVVSDLGCYGTASGSAFILDKISLTSTTGHFQDFSNPSTARWYPDSKAGKEILNTWTFGIPNKPFMNASGINQSWYVNTLGGKSYPVSQKSFLNSPCFDFRGFAKPMVAMDLFINTRQGADGSVFQYSVNGAKSWITLGQIGDGIDWYNSESILSTPSDNNNFPQGWSGLLNGAKKTFSVRHTLDNIRDSSKVRFRLAFSSADATILSDSTYEGIAFDNFNILQRSKIALIEHFENESSTESKYATRGANGEVNGYGLIGVDSIINSSPDNIVSIKYHTSFPNEDAFNLQNPSDVSVRVLNYGVNNVPYTVLDGNVFAANTYANRNTILEDSLKRSALLQTLLTPDFDLKVKSSLNSVEVTIVSRINYTSTSPLILNVAQIERVVRKQGVNGQTKFESVLRNLLPNPAGTVFTQNWLAGQRAVVSLPYNTNLILNASMMGFVGFLQNSGSQLVLQAAYDGPGNTDLALPPLSLNEKLHLQYNAVGVFPNPAQNEINISAPYEIKKVAIRDIAGKELNSINLHHRQSKTATLNTSDLENGFYYLFLELENNILVTKKFVIAK